MACAEGVCGVCADETAGVPHWAQNFAVADRSAPQCEHLRASAAPHSSQNFAPGRYSCWHLAHLGITALKHGVAVKDHDQWGFRIAQGKKSWIDPMQVANLARGLGEWSTLRDGQHSYAAGQRDKIAPLHSITSWGRATVAAR